MVTGLDKAMKNGSVPPKTRRIGSLRMGRERTKNLTVGKGVGNKTSPFVVVGATVLAMAG